MFASTLKKTPTLPTMCVNGYGLLANGSPVRMCAHGYISVTRLRVEIRYTSAFALVTRLTFPFRHIHTSTHTLRAGPLVERTEAPSRTVSLARTRRLLRRRSAKAFIACASIVLRQCFGGAVMALPALRGWLKPPTGECNFYVGSLQQCTAVGRMWDRSNSFIFKEPFSFNLWRIFNCDI